MTVRSRADTKAGIIRTTVLPVSFEVLVLEYLVAAPTHVLDEPVSMSSVSVKRGV